MIFKPGDRVLIRTWKKNPGFWDDDGTMFEMMGTTHTVDRKVSPDRYKLRGSPWTWRKEDFILLKEAKLEPNIAFQMKKRT